MSRRKWAKVLSGCLVCLAGLLARIVPAFPQTNPYTWLEQYEPAEAVVNRIPPPDGYERVRVIPASFAHWLRHLPLKKGRPPVRLHDGREKPNQRAHYAVVDIDVGQENLQQCADAVIRLRAEYLYGLGRYKDIHFKFTTGHDAEFTRWIKGYRPIVDGNNVRWERTAQEDSSYSSFRKYLATVFMYAGSYSLSGELRAVEDASEMKIGDVFIESGFPGHAVIVVDMAVNKRTDEKVFLLAQSYMPAQDVHILRNLTDSELGPWYAIEFGAKLHTPEWVFRETDLVRF